MRKFLLLSWLMISLGTVRSQTFDVDTLLWSGDINKRINYVFLSDGYTTPQLPTFISDANNMMNALFNTTPFKEYQDYFNVFIIKVPSAQSGASHPNTANDCPSTAQHPVSTVNNYFGSTFDYFNIHRLLVPTNSSAIAGVLASNFPNYDQAFIVVNSPYYGGSGGAYATSSTNGSANEIAIHEIGHSFARLADEYYAGDVYAAEKANMTQNTNTATVKWKNWLNTGSVGIYQHCCGGNSANWYRPHQNCKMRYLGDPFCGVCAQTFVKRFHDLTSPIDQYSPNNSVNSSGSPIDFVLDLVYPNPNTLTVNWSLNSTTIANDVDSIQLNASSFLNGVNTLVAMVEDTTALVRIDTHTTHIHSVTWTINHTITGIKTSAQQHDLILKTYPNPFTDKVLVEFELEQLGEVTIQLFNTMGQRLWDETYNNLPIGHFQQQLKLDDIPSGTYVLRLNVNNAFFEKTLIKQ